jgi:hypothetical protein
MAGMGRLIGSDMYPESALFQPEGKFPAQSALALGGVIEASTVQGVTAKGRGTLAGDDKHQPVAALAPAHDKVVEFDAGLFNILAMKIDPSLGFKLAACQSLGQASVEPAQGWRFCLVMGMPFFGVVVWARARLLCGDRCGKLGAWHRVVAAAQRLYSAGHVFPEPGIRQVEARALHRSSPRDCTSLCGRSTVMAPGLFMCPAMRAASSPQPQ